MDVEESTGSVNLVRRSVARVLAAACRRDPLRQAPHAASSRRSLAAHCILMIDAHTLYPYIVIRTIVYHRSPRKETRSPCRPPSPT